MEGGVLTNVADCQPETKHAYQHSRLVVMVKFQFRKPAPGVIRGLGFLRWGRRRIRQFGCVFHIRIGDYCPSSLTHTTAFGIGVFSSYT